MKTIKDSKFWSVTGVSGKIDSLGSFTPETIEGNTGTVGLYSYVRVTEKNEAVTLQKVMALINCDYALKPGTDVDLVLLNLKETEVSTIIAVRKDGIQSDDANSMLKVYKQLNDASRAKATWWRAQGALALVMAVPAMITIILGIILFGIAMYCFYRSSQSKKIASEFFGSLPSKPELHKLINLYMSESAVNQPNSAVA